MQSGPQAASQASCLDAAQDLPRSVAPHFAATFPPHPAGAFLAQHAQTGHVQSGPQGQSPATCCGGAQHLALTFTQPFAAAFAPHGAGAFAQHARTGQAQSGPQTQSAPQGHWPSFRVQLAHERTTQGQRSAHGPTRVAGDSEMGAVKAATSIKCVNIDLLLLRFKKLRTVEEDKKSLPRAASTANQMIQTQSRLCKRKRGVTGTGPSADERSPPATAERDATKAVPERKVESGCRPSREDDNAATWPTSACQHGQPDFLEPRAALSRWDSSWVSQHAGTGTAARQQASSEARAGTVQPHSPQGDKQPHSNIKLAIPDDWSTSVRQDISTVFLEMLFLITPTRPLAATPRRRTFGTVCQVAAGSVLQGSESSAPNLPSVSRRCEILGRKANTHTQKPGGAGALSPAAWRLNSPRPGFSPATHPTNVQCGRR